MIFRRQIISESAGPIFAIFSLNESVSVADDRPGPLFSISQGTLICQPIKVEKSAIYFLALPFGNGLQYHNYDFKRLDRINFSTLCTILVTFGPETRVYVVHNSTFCGDTAKIGISRQISQNILDLPWPTYRFGRRNTGDDFPSIRVAVAKGTLLWQPVKYGRCSQPSGGVTITLWFGIWQWIGRS